MINYNFNITKSIIRDIIKFKKKLNMLFSQLTATENQSIVIYPTSAKSAIPPH